MKIGLNIGLPLPSSSTFLPSLYDLLRRIINQVNFLSDIQASGNVQAGGATVGATDKNGDDLLLRSGNSTGAGESGVKIQTAHAGLSGTADSYSTNVMFQALGNKLAFNGATPITKPTVTGSRGGNAALASLLTALATLGLITDSTTA